MEMNMEPFTLPCSQKEIRYILWCKNIKFLHEERDTTYFVQQK